MITISRSSRVGELKHLSGIMMLYRRGQLENLSPNIQEMDIWLKTEQRRRVKKPLADKNFKDAVKIMADTPPVSNREIVKRNKKRKS